MPWVVKCSFIVIKAGYFAFFVNIIEQKALFKLELDEVVLIDPLETNLVLVVAILDKFCNWQLDSFYMFLLD